MESRHLIKEVAEGGRYGKVASFAKKCGRGFRLYRGAPYVWKGHRAKLETRFRGPNGVNFFQC